MNYSSTSPSLKLHDKAVISAIVVAIIAFSIITLIRSAYLDRPMTDAQVYFRAGWAIANGISPYEIQDDNGWSLFYPPFYCILMVPFADPPPGESQLSFAISYPVSILIFFYASIAALVAATFIMARAVERYFIFQSPSTCDIKHYFWQPYWLLRVGPLIAMAFVLGEGLKRAQVTPFILLLLVLFVVWQTENRSYRSGFALGLASAIKIFPAVALFLPLLRRDWRAIAGFAMASIILWGAVPYLALGHEAFFTVYTEFVDRLTGIAFEGSGAGGIGGISADAIGWGSLAIKHLRVLTGQEHIIYHHELPSVHYPILAMTFALCIFAFHGRVWTFGGEQPQDKRALLIAGTIIVALLVSAATAAQVHYIALGLPLHMAIVAWSWIKTGQSRITLLVFLLGVSYWVFPIINGWPSLGGIAWAGVAVYPLIFSIIAGLLLLRSSSFIVSPEN